ncbi:hypothetical protein GN956_G21116 [Arapaima gigas]
MISIIDSPSSPDPEESWFPGDFYLSHLLSSFAPLSPLASWCCWDFKLQTRPTALCIALLAHGLKSHFS